MILMLLMLERKNAPQSESDTFTHVMLRNVMLELGKYSFYRLNHQNSR